MVSKGRTHLPERNLDILRAAAVSCVLLGHTLGAMGLPYPLWLGRAGVLAFFVHTSLVLMSSLERGGPRDHWVQAFYIRRAFRIYPLCIVAVLTVAALGIPRHLIFGEVPPPVVEATARTVIANITLTQNLIGAPDIYGVLWSLPLEVQMYVLLPLCFLIARRSPVGVLAMVAAAVAAGAIVLVDAAPGVWRLEVLTFAPCFMGGVLAYHLLFRGVRPRVPAIAWPIAMGAVCALFGLQSVQPARAVDGWLPCLILGAILPFFRDAADSWLTRVSHTICTYSYGIYLLHLPALWVAFWLLRGQPAVVQWVAFAVLIGALPYLGYRFIERPGILFGHNVAARPVLAVTGEVPAP
jgi:peptidoglycan/LPS O-acetylase OafA/YrhL